VTDPFLTDLPVALARRLEKACDRFEAAWHSGGRPRLDDFLADAGDDLYPILLRELVLLDAGYRREAGERPSAADYQKQFPGLAPAWLEEAREEDAGSSAAASSAPAAATGPERVQETVDEVCSGASQGLACQAQDVAAEVPAALAEHPRYRVLKALGRGGMGTVYLAEHKVMKRTVALKVIRPELTARPEAVERFRREVQAAARLTHPNIVASHDAEQVGDCLFLAMEYVEGTDLTHWLQTHGPLPVAEACDYVRQAALGLQHAHEQGMVHRDLKPQNLMRTAAGQVKVLDFGLARLVELAQEGGTASGIVLGTPDYMAPEQANEAHGADIRADVYSLGCTLYHLLAGQVPFPGGGIMDKLRRLAQEQPEPLGRLRPELPAALVGMVEWMMAKDPAQRPQTPAEVAGALAPWCRPELEAATPTGSLPASGRWWRRRAMVLAAVVLVLVLGAGLTYFATKGPGEVKAGDRAPDLSKMNLLIDDDFSDPAKSGFGLAKDDGFGRYHSFENGRYVIRLSPKPGISNSWAFNSYEEEVPLEGDFACQVTGHILTKGDRGWGLCLFTPKRDRSVAIRLCWDGSAEVGNVFWDNKEDPRTTVGPIRHPAILSGDQLNTLLVICRGGRMLEVYVNGFAISGPIQLPQPIAPVCHGMLLWGRGRRNSEWHAEFTRYTLWQLSR